MLDTSITYLNLGSVIKYRQIFEESLVLCVTVTRRQVLHSDLSILQLDNIFFPVYQSFISLQ